MTDEALARACVETLRAEADAVRAYADRGGADMARAARMIHASFGPLIVAGIGKSGLIAGKIASTLRSIGKAAIFLHPGEASHGDLGLITDGSVLLILSNSGETTELSDLLAFAKSHGTPIIALTGHPGSTLAQAAEITIAYGKVTEADPNGLAPTTSTALQLAVGDALAVGVTHLLGTAAEDFRRYHPGGKLGAMLLSVGDLMHTGDALPVVGPETEMSQTVVVMSEKAFGVALVVDGARITGIITDGDMRRHSADLWSYRAGDIATPDPFTVAPGMRAAEALTAMTARKITAAIVAGPDGGLIGLLHIHDILRAGVAS